MTFKDLLKQYHIPSAPEGHHHCREGWIQIDCPFCAKDSHKWHMGYSLEDRFVNCWRCGSHPLLNTLLELGIPSKEAYLFTKEKIIKPLKKRIITSKLKIPKGVGELLPAHKHYLKERGFHWKRLQKIWHIQGIGIASNLSWRIFIPIYSQDKMVSWTTRSISNSEHITRYISAPLEEESIPHKSLLYGEEYAQHNIIIVEGPTDVWRIGPGAAATLGLNYTQAQINRMLKYSIRAICFDNQLVAQNKAKE